MPDLSAFDDDREVVLADLRRGELHYEDDMVVLYSGNRVAYLTPLQHQDALLTLSEGARRRVLAKTRKLEERLLLGTDMPRRPGI